MKKISLLTFAAFVLCSNFSSANSFIRTFDLGTNCEIVDSQKVQINEESDTIRSKIVSVTKESATKDLQGHELETSKPKSGFWAKAQTIVSQVVKRIFSFLGW